MGGEEQYWDNIAPKYAALYDNDWSYYEDSLLAKDLRRLLSTAVGKRVLDIGCGTGLGYELLRAIDSKIQYVGIDVSGGMLREFNKKHPEVQTIRASGEKVLEFFSACQFDVVVSTNVAASFPADTTKLLRGVFNVLIPDGVMYLSFLNRWSLRRLTHRKFARAEQYRTRGDEQNREFVWANTYTPGELVRICHSLGFKDTRCFYRGVLGGVWESATAVRVERVVARIAARLGHLVVVTGARRKDAVGDEKMEALLRA